jgi:hypothetical protein
METSMAPARPCDVSAGEKVCKKRVKAGVAIAPMAGSPLRPAGLVGREGRTSCPGICSTLLRA